MERKNVEMNALKGTSRTGNLEERVSSLRLLYVDDEPDLLELGKIYLEKDWIFSVTTRNSAAAALALLENEPFDAIVSDYQMPGIDGIQFLKEVRTRFGEIPFILFTGRGREEVVIQAINSGADFYLQKGGDTAAQFTELAHKIRSAVSRRTNERAFKESEQRFRAISEYSHTAISIIDERLRIVWANDMMGELSGYSPEQLYGAESFLGFLAPGSRESASSDFSRFIAGDPYEHHGSFYFVRADGMKRLWERHMMDVEDTHGGRTLVISMMDITEREQAEIDLRESEQKFRYLVEYALEGILILDFQGTILFANNAAARTIETDDRAGLIGRNVMEFIAPESQQAVLEDFIQVSGGHDAFIAHYHAISAKGRKAFIECIGKAVTFDKQPADLISIRDVTEQKNAGDALKESNRKYTELFELGAEAIFLIDNETGLILEANAAASEMYGYVRETLLTMKNTELSAEKEETHKVTTESPHGTIKIPLRYHRRNDGTVFPVEILGRFFTLNGRPVHIAAIRDITERKRAEEALFESHARFTQISGQSRAIIWEVDPEGLYTYVSPASQEIIGYAPEELVGKRHFFDLHPEEGREDFKASIQEKFAQRQVFQNLVNLRQTKDGHVISMSTNGMPFFDEFNNFEGYRGSDSDISELKLAEEIRTRFGRVLESSLNEIYFFDAQSLRFVEVNHGARENIGYSMEELRSMTPLDIMEGYTHASFETLLSPLRTGEKEIQVLFTIHRRKDGSQYPVEVHLQLAGEEVLPVFVAFVLDITERTQTEEALRLANWKLNLLSGITRHDINNQMTVLRGYLSLMEMNPADPLFNEYLQKMDASARRITSMIQFTKEYDEIGITVPAWQDIRSQVSTAANEISFGEIQLKNELPDRMEVFSEPLIFKVFYNLIENAVRYGDTITSIRFYSENRNGDRIIVCEDDGVGIPCDEKEKIFLRGFGRNTGLGLALTREILEITGISIEETGEPGKGARFEITVPKGLWRMAGSP